jgi:hypothetical protein
MRKLWVFLLAAVAFGAGVFAGLAYVGATGSLAGFRVACELLNTAEGAGLLEKAQRADVVERVVREMQRATSDTPRHLKGIELFEQFKTGCPNLPNW